jgi:hypothetical protein
VECSALSALSRLDSLLALDGDAPSAGELKELGVLNDPDALNKLEARFGQEGVNSLRSTGLFNSHFTSSEVVSGIHQGVLTYLVDSHPKRVLDPGIGAGAFFLKSCDYYGVDICPVMSQVAERRGAIVFTQDFLSWRFGLKFPLVWGNVPFTDGTRPGGLGLHARFIEKALSHLDEGGVCALITTTSTLDSRGERMRGWREKIARSHNLLLALRLPPGSHQGKTQSTSDLLVFRKEPGHSDWVHSVPWRDDIHCNEWWMSHPQHVLGEATIDTLRSASGNPCRRMALKPSGGIRAKIIGAFHSTFHSTFTMNTKKQNKSVPTMIQLVQGNQSFLVFSVPLTTAQVQAELARRCQPIGSICWSCPTPVGDWFSKWLSPLGVERVILPMPEEFTQKLDVILKLLQDDDNAAVELAAPPPPDFEPETEPEPEPELEDDDGLDDLPPPPSDDGLDGLLDPK